MAVIPFAVYNRWGRILGMGVCGIDGEGHREIKPQTSRCINRRRHETTLPSNNALEPTVKFLWAASAAARWSVAGRLNRP